MYVYSYMLSIYGCTHIAWEFLYTEQPGETLFKSSICPAAPQRKLFSPKRDMLMNLNSTSRWFFVFLPLTSLYVNEFLQGTCSTFFKPSFCT